MNMLQQDLSFECKHFLVKELENDLMSQGKPILLAIWPLQQCQASLCVLFELHEAALHCVGLKCKCRRPGRCICHLKRLPAKPSGPAADGK